MNVSETDPVTGVFDPAGGDDAGAGARMEKAPRTAGDAAARSRAQQAHRPPREPLRFFRRSELVDYKIPEDVVLVGDSHVFRGGIFVLGGAPGVGKSRAAVALGVAGATGADWFGFPVHRKFRTMIVQSENGPMRLKDEFADLPLEIEDYVFISKDMSGFPFEDESFCGELREAILQKRPDVLILDPWGDAVADSMEKDYRAAFTNIMGCLPDEAFGPALFIVAHTRKPRMGEKVGGRGLLNLLSGSQVLGSKPRAAFILEAASENPEDERVVFTCAKNNNGPLGPRSAWRRCNGLFQRVEDFDWEAFDGGKSSGHGNEVITEELMEDVFESGTRFLSKGEAVAEIMKLAGCSKSAAYNAVDLGKSRFKANLVMEPVGGKIGWSHASQR